MRAILATLTALLLAHPAIAQVRSADLVCIADTSLIQNNLAPEIHLSNGSGDAIFIGRTYVHADYVHRGLVRFDLSTLPCNARISSASLTMRVITGPSGSAPSPTTVHRLLASWGEGASSSFGGRGAPSESGDADWLDRVYPGVAWSAPGGDFLATPSASLDITPDSILATWGPTPQLTTDAQNWLLNPALNFGWLLRTDESRLGTVRKFASRETDFASNKPTLHLQYTTCTADFDCSGAANVQDIFRFLAGWFAAEPATDVNDSGTITVADIFDFLAAWFAGC